MNRSPAARPWNRLQHWRHRLTVPQFTAVTGLLVIALGTLILASPLCSTSEVGLWEALFTVTSAITVTGLSIIDVGHDLTPFGQAALAALIMVGGLGLMAITTFLQGFVQGRSGLRQRLDKGRALDEFGVGSSSNASLTGFTTVSVCIAITFVISMRKSLSPSEKFVLVVASTSSCSSSESISELKSRLAFFRLLGLSRPKRSVAALNIVT